MQLQHHPKKNHVLQTLVACFACTCLLLSCSALLPGLSAQLADAEEAVSEEEQVRLYAEETYPLCSVVVLEENVEDAGASETLSASGVTVLTYETAVEAAVADAELSKSGYETFPDALVEVCTNEIAQTDDGGVSVETDTAAVGTWENERMGLSCNAGQGERGAVVAVIDTGCTTSAFDSTRIVDTYNAKNNSADVTDNANHGTKSASVVLRNCGENVSCLPIKVMDANSANVSLSTFARAFNYAAGSGCDVINMSISLLISADSTAASYLGAIIDSMVEEEGITFTTAAGNDSVSVNSYFPANWESTWAVAATDSDDELAPWSNHGTKSHPIDFSCPGENITVTNSSGKKAHASGTSFSAPLAAAAAAQLSCMGYETDGERLAYLIENCDVLTNGEEDYTTGNGLPVMEHSYSLVKSATAANGTVTSTYECACGATKRTVETPAGVSTGKITAKERKAARKALNSKIQLKVTKAGKLKITWGKAATAGGYDVYAGECNGDAAARVRTVSAGKRAISVSAVASGKVNAAKCYKAKVRAWRYVDGKKAYLCSSYVLHAAGPDAKLTNAKKVNFAKKSVSVCARHSKRVKASVIAKSARKKLLSHYTAPLRWFSADESVAIVNALGRIRGVSAGTTYVYAVAVNGVKAKVKVKVKG